jgi:hypothetical protein
MANKDNSERIEKYLREQMTPEENEAFLNDLKSDKELREEAQMMALLIKEMKEELAKQDEAIANEILASKEKSTAKTTQLVKWIGSIAAMFILIFGATTLWNRPSNTEVLFNEYYTPFVYQPDRSGGDETIKKELAELYDKVGTEKDITPIIARLQTIYDGIQSNSNDFADYSYYENDIAWYLALAYIKDNNLDKAKEILQPLVDNNDAEAIKLMAEIEGLQ